MREIPATWPCAAHAVGRCIVHSAGMFARDQVHLSRDWVGRIVQFGDGSSGRIYRETVVADRPARPCVLSVCFRLRGVRGRGHKLFEWESLLNTPLFVGFPGFGTKLWIAHDAHETYRGIYEWDRAEQAASYARSLWRVLQLVSVTGSIHYRVLPDTRREEFFAGARGAPRAGEPTGHEWWEVVALR